MSPYTTGAIAMRELAATAADERGQHGVAAAIRALALPAVPDEPFAGLRLEWDDEPAKVVHAAAEYVVVRFDRSGAVRWPTREQWRDAVRSGAIRVLG